MSDLIVLIDRDIKDIDSCIRCHNIMNDIYNRKIYKVVSNLLDYVIFSYELNYINELHFQHFYRLLCNRKKKLNNCYVNLGGDSSGLKKENV